MKTVLMPIQVPDGKYCWEHSRSPADKYIWQHTSSYEICEHFDNEGGHSSCNIGFYPLIDTVNGVLKSPECYKLKNYDPD